MTRLALWLAACLAVYAAARVTRWRVVEGDAADAWDWDDEDPEAAP